jgi:hypothetical protein
MLQQNGFDLVPLIHECEEVIVALATGKMGVERFANWLQDSSRPRLGIRSSYPSLHLALTLTREA